MIGLYGDNVLLITGSPHRLTQDRLSAELKKFSGA